MTKNQKPLETAKQVFLRTTLALFVLSFAINLLLLTGPLFMLQVYDRVLPSGSVQTLLALSAIVVLLFIFKFAFDAVRARIFSRVGMRIDEVLERPAFDAVMRGGSRNEYALAQPLRDLETIKNYFASGGPAAFFDVPWIPAFVFLLYVFHPWFAIVAGGAAAILLLMALLTELATGGEQRKAAGLTENAQKFADDITRQHEVINALGMGNRLARLWQAQKSEAQSHNRMAGDRSALFSNGSKTLRLFFQSLTLGVGAYLVIHHDASSGTMIASSIVLSRALAPIDQLIGQWRMLLNARRAWSRLSGLIETDRKPLESPIELPAPKGHIKVSSLLCFVTDRSAPLLGPIDFELTPGMGLGIIGPSGGGKSTLVKALLGIWPAVRGEVRLDAATLDQWDREQLSRHIGFLPQDAAVLPGTIAQNIARFEPDATSETIVEAAKLAGIHELVLSFPEGYNSRISNDGILLSAGQKQRLALARAVFGKPALVIMDEPNSNLDAPGDQALAAAIKTLRARGTTVIVVAHRPGALAELDTLLFIASGRQVSFGPKDEVLAQVVRPTQEKAASENTGDAPAAPRRKVIRLTPPRPQELPDE